MIKGRKGSIIRLTGCYKFVCHLISYLVEPKRPKIYMILVGDYEPYTLCQLETKHG